MKKVIALIISLPLLLLAAEWQSLDGPPLGRADDMSIGWHSGIPGWVIYAADKTHKLYKSTNEGELWAPIEHEDIINPTCVITDENNAQVVYIGEVPESPNTHCVWKSTDGGDHWDQKLSDVQIFSIDFATQFTGYAGSNEGVYKTTNGGEYWVLLPNSPQYSIKDLKTITTSKVYAATGSGMFMTEDGGDTWEEINEGIYTNRMFSLIAHPENSQTFFAGGEKGIYKTVNGGKNWQEIIRGFKLSNLKSVSNLPKNKNFK